MHAEDVFTGLTDQQVLRILTLIQAIKNEMAFNVKRTPEERQALNSVDEGRLPFVEAGAEITKDHHLELMIDSAEVARTARIAYDFKMMSKIHLELESLFEGVNDTTMQIGSNLYGTCLVVKDLLEVAIKRRKPGMEVLSEKMNKLFERSPSKPKGENTNGDQGSNGEQQG